MKLPLSVNRLLQRLALPLIAAVGLNSVNAEPLTIAYSDWPGWTPWEIAIKKGWFEEAGVEVDFKWMDYVGSLDAFAAGNLDGC